MSATLLLYCYEAQVGGLFPQFWGLMVPWHGIYTSWLKSRHATVRQNDLMHNARDVKGDAGELRGERSNDAAP